MSETTPMEEAPRRLEAVLLHEIPLATAMGLQVQSWDGQALRLRAPLEPNLNHKATAFGGSLYSLAALAGWGMVWLILDEAGIDRCPIVVQRSEVEYGAPVDQDLEAICERPEAELEAKFLRGLERHGRARLKLEAKIGDVIYRGSYAVLYRTAAT